MPQAHLADGTVLDFPDGTDESVIDATVKKHLGVPQQEHKGLLDQIRAFTGTDKVTADKENAAYDKKVANLQEGPTKPGKILSPLISGARPFAIPAAMEVGGQVAAAAPGGIGFKALAGGGAAAATYLGVDPLLQRLQSYMNGDNKESSLGDSLSNLAVNEIGGRMVGAGIKKLTPSQETLSKLEPTVAQYLGNSPVLKSIEDLFAPTAKKAAILNSGALGNKEVTNIAANQAKRWPGTVDNIEKFGGIIQEKDLGSALAKSKIESNTQAQTAKIIAKGNPTQVQIGVTQPVIPSPQIMDQFSQSLNSGKTFAQLDPATQQATIKAATGFGLVKAGGQPILKTVEGPIALTSTLEKVNEIVQSVKGLDLGPSEQEKPLINKALKLIQGTNAKFDPNGKLVSSTPLSFEEGWDTKQGLDELGGWNKSKNDITPTDLKFRDLAKSVNADIDTSIPTWKNGSVNASKAWKNAKETVAERNQLFYTQNASNKLGDIIEEANSPLPSLDKMLADPRQLQRALNAGEAPFPSGKVPSNNLRKDMAGYNLIRMRDASKTINPLDPTGISINATKLMNEWQDPSFVQQKDLLYSKAQQQDYTQLFQNLAITQEKPSGFGQYLAKFKMVGAGFVLAPALVTGVMTHSVENAAGVAGIEIGAGAVAKLMTNPKTAKILVAAAAGQPLNMSEQQAARLVASQIQGTSMVLLDSKGGRQKGSIGRDGRFSLDSPGN